MYCTYKFSESFTLLQGISYSTVSHFVRHWLLTGHCTLVSNIGMSDCTRPYINGQVQQCIEYVELFQYHSPPTLRLYHVCQPAWPRIYIHLWFFSFLRFWCSKLCSITCCFFIMLSLMSPTSSSLPVWWCFVPVPNHKQARLERNYH